MFLFICPHGTVREYSVLVRMNELRRQLWYISIIIISRLSNDSLFVVRVYNTPCYRRQFYERSSYRTSLSWIRPVHIIFDVPRLLTVFIMTIQLSELIQYSWDSSILLRNLHKMVVKKCCRWNITKIPCSVCKGNMNLARKCIN